jgi:isopentenyl-diphosphate delta-isomerase
VIIAPLRATVAFHKQCHQIQGRDRMSTMIPAYIDGVLTPVEKLSVHERGLKHLAISVFLIADGKILMQRRALSKYHTPGLWANTCCTHPHWGEDTPTAAIRRLDDELGIKGVQLKQRDTVEYRADVPPNLIEHEVADIFVGHCEIDHPITRNPDEAMEIRWMSPNDLRDEIVKTPEIFTPWLKIYIAEHADKIFNSSDFT